MKISGVLLLVASVALLAGCGSGLELSNDFDQQIDFSQYKTFQWVPSKDSSNDLLESRIKSATIDQLTQKGMVSTTTDPDVYVIYHAGAKDKVDIQSYGYGYGYGRYGGVYGGAYGAGSGGISTYNYTEGTLIIDIIDASSKQLAWRGSATGVLDESPSAEKITENVNKAIAAIMSQYPPKK
ncbi:MAG: DUF4136 domain-containing protein [Candidatus Krumholzibacteria bacterium]|nr:DUF4136 domain-containing protein [Candidatus Krumholzibacteria bacterium]